MAYARRAALLAEDLNAWALGYRDVAFGPDHRLVNWQRRDRAESRAYGIEDLVAQLRDISMQLAALR